MDPTVISFTLLFGNLTMKEFGASEPTTDVVTVPLDML